MSLEVTGGFEPPLKVLQTYALPLGYVTKYYETVLSKMTPTRIELVLPP